MITSFMGVNVSLSGFCKLLSFLESCKLINGVFIMVTLTLQKNKEAHLLASKFLNVTILASSMTHISS